MIDTCFPVPMCTLAEPPPLDCSRAASWTSAFYLNFHSAPDHTGGIANISHSVASTAVCHKLTEEVEEETKITQLEIRKRG